MSKITRQDSDGVKPLLSTGELGYDNYPAGGDVGRVYVGTGSANIAQAKKSEVDSAVVTTNAHIGRVDNPHSVTKTQVGLSNVDNTSDLNKPISTATQTALNTAVKLTGTQTIADVKTFTSNIVGNITGNSGTATKLQTARTINGVAFDGSANITAPTNLGITAGTTAGPIVTSSTGTNATLPTASATASGVVTTGNQTVAGIKTFSSNIVGSITGNSATATTLATARTINGVSFNGSANITISDSTKVALTGNETIAGIKTFSSSPIVPTPTTDFQASTKKYVDDNITPPYNPTPPIATGTATFDSVTNNISLAGIGIGVEIGDVIQISGATDSKNNSEFTVEVITDNDNIIVNQAHAGKGTTKNVADRSSDTGVTVKLLAKWYNAPIGLGQDLVDVTASRISGVTYTNNKRRAAVVSCFTTTGPSTGIDFYINGVLVSSQLFDEPSGSSALKASGSMIVPNNATYMVSGSSKWFELR